MCVASRQKTHAIRNFAAVVAVASAAVASAATTQDDDHLSPSVELEQWTGDLDRMIERRVIRALVPYNKTQYFVDLGGTQRGISYDAMRAFEEQLNRKLKRGKLRVHVVIVPTPSDQLITDLLAGRGDIAASNITITPQRRELVDFTNPFASNVREIVVTGPGAPILRSIDDLAGKQVFIRRTSSQFSNLVALNRDFEKRGLPKMELQDAPTHFETEDILEMVNAGLVKITVADDYLAKVWQSVHTKLTLHDDLPLQDSVDIAFAIRKHSPKLLAELNAFARTHKQGTTFGNVTLQKYLSQTKWVKGATSPAQLKRFNTLVGLFQKYGDRYRIDWLLMAAQGYQESQLNQTKRSPVGAIGIMQVMPQTGKQMRTGDIKQLEPNIHAGVKYVRHIIDEYFDDPNIDEFNRTLLALASYNAGPTRIAGLRKEAARRKLDPNKWFNNVERVAAERIGRETVQYVGNIYKYYIAYSLVQQQEMAVPNATAAAIPVP